jgi:hypothetical protein
MKGWLRPLGALGVVIGGLAAMVVPLPADAVGAQPDTIPCVDIEILLLMDQSASLRETDPEAHRIDAAEALVESLSLATEATGGSVNLHIASFGEDVKRLGGGGFSLPAEATGARAAIDEFRRQRLEQNTDYVLALKEAVDHFAEIEAPQQCKRLLWFTDGAYSIDRPDAVAPYTDLRDKAEIERLLEAFVCGPLPEAGVPAGGGLVSSPLSQQIRSAGFEVQLVDLRLTGEAGRQRVLDERAATDPVLERMFEIPGDDCAVPGGRLLLGQADDLVAEFFEQGQRAAGRQSVACELFDRGSRPPSCPR